MDNEAHPKTVARRRDWLADFTGIALAIFGVLYLSLRGNFHGYHELAIFLPAILQVLIMQIQNFWRKNVLLTINGRTLKYTTGKLKEGEAENIVEAFRR